MVPKAMVTLRNKPYIQYMVDFLRAARLEGAVLAMGYLPHPIRQHFAEQGLSGFTLEYVVECSPLGTAGGIKNAQEHLGGGEGPFVVTNGDVLTGLDLAEVIEAHQGSDALARITSLRISRSWAKGDATARVTFGVIRTGELGKMPLALARHPVARFGNSCTL
jgi:mannose-1-phosphate guanylyltransferase